MKRFNKVLLTVYLLMIMYSIGDAQPVFQRQIIAEDFDGAWIVHACDLDDDGDIDILASAYDGDELKWWENIGGNFLPHSITEDYDGANWIEGADIDNDGDLDLVTTAGEADLCNWWENDGEENFTVQHTVATTEGAFGCDVIDMDNDGDLDIILGGFYNNSIDWWENEGAGVFINEHEVANDFVWVDMGLHGVDLDGDENIDIVATSRADNEVCWFENIGNVFTEHLIDNGLTNACWCCTEDLDVDGDLDILATGFVADDVNWYRNEGFQEFEENNIVNNYNGAVCAKPGDIDNDGDLDVVACAALADNISWFENDGDMNFTQFLIDDSSGYCCHLSLVDIDNDGDIDVLATAWTADQVVIYENKGNAPLPFDLYSPEDGETVNQDIVSVTWFSSTDPDTGDVITYRLDWSLDSEFPLFETYSELTEDTTFVITDLVALFQEDDLEIDELPDDSTIYWRVKAIDSEGNSTWSWEFEFGWSFNIYVPDPPVAFNLMTPNDGNELAGLEVTLGWTESSDPDPDDTPRYDVWLDTNPDLSTAFQVADSLETTSFNYLNINFGTEYYWTVRATDSNTGGTWASDTFLFISPSDVENLYQTLIPADYSIVSAHPNPFNQSLSIVIGLPQPSELKVRIYNILGEEVNVLTDQAHRQGFHTFVFEGSGLSTGIYFVQANVSGKWSNVKKVVLMK